MPESPQPPAHPAEEAPPAPAAPSPPMTGRLTTIGVPDLLRRAYSERFTGELLLSRGDEQKQIYFETGNIVFAASNQPADRIGTSLLRQGLITQDDFNRILAQAHEGKRFGQALVEAGLMSERDLITNITFQVLDIIYSVFNWTTGAFEFIPGEHRVAEELKLKLTTASIILEGVRRIEDFGIIRRGLGDLNRFIAPSSSPLLRLQTMTLKPFERQLLELITQPLDLLHILVVVSSPPAATLKAIFGLISAGVLEQTEPPTLSRDTGKFELPAALRPVIPLATPTTTSQAQPAYSPDYAAFRSRLDELWARIRLNNPHLILNVPVGAALEDINFAYLRLADQFHPDRFLTAPIPLRREVEEAFRHIVQSFEYLRQQALQVRLQRTTGRFMAVPGAIPGLARTTGAYPAAPTAPAPPPARAAARTPNPVKPTGNAEVDAAIDDLLAYLDDQKAPSSSAMPFPCCSAQNHPSPCPASGWLKSWPAGPIISPASATAPSTKCCLPRWKTSAMLNAHVSSKPSTRMRFTKPLSPTSCRSARKSRNFSSSSWAAFGSFYATPDPAPPARRRASGGSPMSYVIRRLHDTRRRCLAYALTGSLFFGLTLGGTSATAQSPNDPPTRPRTYAATPADRVTLPAGTALTLELLTPVHTRINAPGDEVIAQLRESVRLADGTLVLPRGTEVRGTIAAVNPARMPQRAARLQMVFDTVITDLGNQPLAAVVVSIDDVGNEARLRADQSGTVSGGHSGRRTVQNTINGGWLGSIGSGIIVLSGGSGAAAAGALGGGALGGVLLTRGNDIRLPSGTIVRLSLTKPNTFAL